MLASDDLQLARRDNDVRGLATVLDAGALTQALREHLPDASIDALEPIYAHYKPHTNCLVACRVRTADEEGLVYAKAYGADADVKLEKTRELEAFPTPLGPGTLVLESDRIGCYFFPVDHRLKALRRLASPDTRRSLIRDLLGDFPEAPAVTLRHLRYKPERRYVACLETPGGPRFLLKFFTPERYRAAKAAAQVFSAQGLGVTERNTCYLDKHNVMGLEWLHGRLLSDIILTAGDTHRGRARVAEGAGSALARLHSAEPAGLKEIRRTDEIARLEAQATTIRYLCPSLGERADEIVELIVPALGEIGEETMALHGDFYDKQVLIADGSPLVLDLDEASQGHPAIDIGLFTAHLERHGLCGRLSSQEVDIFAEALVRGYRRVRSTPSHPAIRLYTAIGLLHLAAEPFRYRETNWRGQIGQVLSRIETLLNRPISAAPSHPARVES